MRININNDETQVYLGNDSHDHADASIQTSSLVKGIIDQFKTWADLGIFLPRLVWMNNDHTALVYERPPFMANIEFHTGKQGMADDIGVAQFAIPVPWTVWGIQFDSASKGFPNEIRLFARNKPILSTEDSLYYLPLPNMDPNARCCTGPGFVSVYNNTFLEKTQLARAAGQEASITIAERVNQILNLFWQAIFNMDYIWTENYRLPESIPDHIRQQTNDRIKSIDFLQWWSEHTLEQAVSFQYALANTMTHIRDNTYDTVGDLIAMLDSDREHRYQSLAHGHRLMSRAINSVTRTQI